MTISTTTTIKAMATKIGMTDSSVSSAAYTINIVPAQESAPTFTPAAGAYISGQSVTLASATPGAIIIYTTDGSVPAFTASGDAAQTG
ncbi:MAG TPA: chitobiase/beta-hexosaminidase C-terminal domain-containing protein, partial [Candidatus Wallbacteria bacterium]|nr:chitobiase/beta-hexosaminidase C-terminal domain-containing protein [Candidatus Wallbacteria bacterium]